jgi:uncharacterized protein YbjT (DUF2867 family)
MPQSYQGKIVTIFGGTGFVGRYVVSRLASLGAIVRVVTRTPQSAYFLKTMGSVGQISAATCTYNNLDSFKEVIKGSYAVVNCLGILFENSKQKFNSVHAQCARMIAEASAQSSVERLVHISALGCDTSHSQYGISKKQGEKEILKFFPNATILRPSVIFGAEDNFFNMFAKLSLFSPALPLINGGKTLFQPVYVGDVADAVLQSLNIDQHSNQSPLGKIYELGGSEILSFKEILERLSFHTGRKPMLINLPTPIARVQAFFLSILPVPLLTQDQITSLETDNIVNKHSLTLNDLHLTPTSLNSILPNYLEHYKSGGRFSNKKRA